MVRSPSSLVSPVEPDTCDTPCTSIRNPAPSPVIASYSPTDASRRGSPSVGPRRSAHCSRTKALPSSPTDMSTCRPLAGQRAWYDKGRRQRPFPFWILGRQPNQTVASSASPARSSVLLTLAPCLNHVRRSSSVLPACIHLDFATTPRGHRAAVAALAVLVRRDLLEVIAAKRHDAGVADLDEPIVIDKRSTRGTSACHLLGEGETERAPACRSRGCRGPACRA